MSDDPVTVIEHAWRAWAQRDKLAGLDLFSDDIVCANSVPPEALPFGAGATVGKPAATVR